MYCIVCKIYWIFDLIRLMVNFSIFLVKNCVSLSYLLKNLYLKKWKKEIKNVKSLL